MARRPDHAPMLPSRCGECLLFSAIEGMADALILVDLDGYVFHLNRRGQELLGVSSSEAARRPVEQLLGHPRLLAFWEGAAERVAGELALDGRNYRATVSDCRDDSGQLIGRALLVRDVTHERRLQVEISTAVAERFLQMTAESNRPQPLPELTRRQRDVLRLVADGLSNAAIAGRLGVSVNTVATHLKQLYSRLGVENRAQATAMAVAHGLRPSPDKPRRGLSPIR